MLLGGIVCVSTAGPFMVAAHVDAYVMALLRLTLGGILFLVAAAVRRELRIPAAHLGRLVVGGLLLVAHWAFWIKAFDLTDFASNLLLLVAQPVIAALISHWLGERQGPAIWLSVGLALVGLVIIAGGDVSLGRRALIGDAMCILGGLFITLFFVVTRDARASLPLTAFLGVTFAVGAVAIAPVVALTGGSLMLPPASWGWIALLVVITTAFGHGLMNLAARQVTLFEINVVIVLEPPIGIALGAVLFGARVTTAAVLGGVFLIASVVLALRPRRNPI